MVSLRPNGCVVILMFLILEKVPSSSLEDFMQLTPALPLFRAVQVMNVVNTWSVLESGKTQEYTEHN